MTAHQLTEVQRIDWLQLMRSEGIGPRTFHALVRQFGGAAAALERLPEISARRGRPGYRIASRADAEREMAEAGRRGIRFIAVGEAGYPRTLQAIDTAPPLIAVRGSVETLGRPMLAVVGSRNASAAGLTFAERLSRDLGGAGYVIVSGLARGIDSRAHKAALATGTVAVLAGGHDRVYPAENEPLLERIVTDGGAVVSEMPLAWEPRGRDFPRRNRIVSGLSYGVVVVEAAHRSGSLITARFALEQGREVFAVPGSPLDPRAEGANELIRGGATLCSAAEHVTAVLAPLIGADIPGPPEARYDQEGLWDELDLGNAPAADGQSQADPPERDDGESADERTRVIRLLGPAPVSVDDLARQSGLSIRTIHMTLLELELAGRIERHGGNAVSMLAKPGGASSAS
jgi:DNA processing protein